MIFCYSAQIPLAECSPQKSLILFEILPAEFIQAYLVQYRMSYDGFWKTLLEGSQTWKKMKYVFLLKRYNGLKFEFPAILLLKIT